MDAPSDFLSSWLAHPLLQTCFADHHSPFDASLDPKGPLFDMLSPQQESVSLADVLPLAGQMSGGAVLSTSAFCSALGADSSTSSGLLTSTLRFGFAKSALPLSSAPASTAAASRMTNAIDAVTTLTRAGFSGPTSTSTLTSEDASLSCASSSTTPSASASADECEGDGKHDLEAEDVKRCKSEMDEEEKGAVSQAPATKPKAKRRPRKMTDKRRAQNRDAQRNLRARRLAEVSHFREQINQLERENGELRDLVKALRDQNQQLRGVVPFTTTTTTATALSSSESSSLTTAFLQPSFDFEAVATPVEDEFSPRPPLTAASSDGFFP